MTAGQGFGSPKRRPPKNRSQVAVLATGFVLLVALVVAGVIIGPRLLDDNESIGSSDGITEPGEMDAADQSVAAFAAALEADDLSSLRFARSVTEPTVADYQEITRRMAPFTITAAPGPAALIDSVRASAPIDLTWSFPGGAEWTTSSEVDVELVNGEWLPVWEPSILEPTLAPGDTLVREQLVPPRAPILGRDGTVLVGGVDLVDVGIRPSRVEDLPALAGQLQAILGVDAGEVIADVEAAGPDQFVDVITLSRADYEEVRDQIFPLPGTVFRETNRPAPLSPTFARALLGRSGEVTAETIEQYPDLFQPGDIAGLSGLQALYNPVLVGRPGVEISVSRAPGNTGPTTTSVGITTTAPLRDPNRPVRLFSVPAEQGEAVVTTIEPSIQRAAETALERTELTSAMVVVEVSTGHVLAVANGPAGASVDFATTGQYPPGSIFKVVTGYALLTNGLGPNDPVDCPQRVTVQGRSFGNAEDEVFGVIPFHEAFAHSCNTAFVGATLGFDNDTIADAAADFGLGTGFDMGSPAFSGSVPEADGPVDLAASSFGQGRVLVSPLSAAVMAATAAGGQYRSPVLVTSPEPSSPQVVEPLEPSAAGTLQELMREVVTNGTGRAVARVNGGPVSGKTGTAEFGNQNPPQSHAWFVGFQGDLAFAVLVEAGEFGGSTAAPIAAEFLNIVAGQPPLGSNPPPPDDEPEDETEEDDEPDETSDSDESESEDDGEGEATGSAPVDSVPDGG